MSTIQKPGYGAYAAAPGRNSTFFNNPYMGQIANNLSSAIYGNPQDELVRERILTAQADRARVKEQDEIAANKTERESQAMTGLAAAMPGMYREDGSIDPELWSNYVSENDLASIFTTEQMIELMPRNASYYRRKAEGTDDLNNKKDLASFEGDIKLDYLGAEYGHKGQLSDREAGHDIDLANLNGTLDQDLAKLNNKYDMLGSVFGDLTSRGGKNSALNAELADILDMDEFGNYSLFTSDGLEHGSAAAATHAKRKLGIDIDAQEVLRITELIEGSLGVRPGDEGYTGVFTDAMDLYAKPEYGGDSSKVLAELARRWKIQPWKKGIISDTLPSATRIPSDLTATPPPTTRTTRPNRDPAGIR
jgi:hypothetical protein